MVDWAPGILEKWGGRRKNRIKLLESSQYGSQISQHGGREMNEGRLRESV